MKEGARLHPAGAAVQRLLARKTGPASASAMAPEQLAADWAERAELHPSAAFVALDLARLGGTRGGERARMALVLLLLDALERGSTRLDVSGPPERAVLAARLAAIGVSDAIVREVEALSSELATRAPARPAPIDEAQLSIDLRTEAPSALASPLLAPPEPQGRTVIEVVRKGARTELALSRWSDAEQQIQRALSGRRARLAPPETVLATLAAMPPASSTTRFRLEGEQQRAVSAALLGPTTLVTGGPGTGKTSIVVAMLRAFVRLKADAGVLGPSAIALAAPTGKAADRMREAVTSALSGATDARDVALRDQVAPMTLHRLLGYQPDLDRYRHHAASRLPHRLVVVDEASMLDVMLLGRLVDALADDALLVLLGDPDQLPSVGAGAVLRDLGLLARALPDAITVAPLTHSHRMSGSDPAGAHVLSVARAIGAGTPPGLAAQPLTPGAWTTVVDGAFPEGASLLPTPRMLGPWLDRWLDDLALDPRVARVTFGALEDPSPLGGTHAAAIEEAIRKVHASRLLVVTRGAGARTSQSAVNAYLGARHAQRLGRPPSADVLAGEPVVVIANDYLRGIYNGDTGIVVEATVGGATMLALALVQRGQVRLLPLLDVRPLIERAWALTVHRAQGSEHDRVALLLPEVDVPKLMTREIIYTAVTRAKKAVQVVGDPALLATAIERRQDRRTGLGSR